MCHLRVSLRAALSTRPTSRSPGLPVSLYLKTRHHPPPSPLALHQSRRPLSQALRAFLATQPAQTRAPLLAALRRDLEDLGMAPFRFP